MWHTSQWLTYIATENETPKQIADRTRREVSELIGANQGRFKKAKLTTNVKLKEATLLLLPLHPLVRASDGVVSTCDVCARRTKDTLHCNACDWDVCDECERNLTADELRRVQCGHDEEFVSRSLPDSVRDVWRFRT